MKYRAIMIGLLLGSPSAWCAEALPIDPGHTAVVFSWNHSGYSHPIARLETVKGTVFLDRADLTRSSVSVVMALEGLRTGDAALDKRLRGKYFFDIAQYPQITFKSTRVEVVDTTNQLRITGDLSVHGITHPVSLEAQINRMTLEPSNKSAAGFDAKAVLRRSDFGLGRYVPLVSDELTVHITLEAHTQ